MSKSTTVRATDATSDSNEENPDERPLFACWHLHPENDEYWNHKQQKVEDAINDTETVADLAGVQAFVMLSLHFDRKVEEGGDRPALEEVDKKCKEEPCNKNTEEYIVCDLPRLRRNASDASDEQAHRDLDERDGSKESYLVDATKLENQGSVPVMLIFGRVGSITHLNEEGKFLVLAVIQMLPSASIRNSHQDVRIESEAQQLLLEVSDYLDRLMQ